MSNFITGRNFGSQIQTADLADNATTNVKMADDALGIAELSATATASSSTRSWPAYDMQEGQCVLYWYSSGCGNDLLLHEAAHTCGLEAQQRNVVVLQRTPSFLNPKGL